MPDSTFWLDWIQERIQASGSDPALLDGLDGCFEIALSNCASVQIAQEWINNILHRHEAGLMDNEVIQSLLENIVSKYGVDIMDGATLYSCLTEFQQGIIEDMVDIAANEDNIQTAKEALVSTYRRQYALPLLGNQRSLTKFENLLSEICVESDEQWIKPELLLEKFKRSEQLLQSRILYEQNILSEDFLSSSLGDQVTAWKTYIQFEIEDKQPARAHRLFERSIIANHQSIELWQDFAEFAETILKQWDIVESVASRALKVHHSNIDLWLQYFIAIESSISNPQLSMPSLQNSDLSKLDPKIVALNIFGTVEERFQYALETALTCSFNSAEDYLAILLHSCDIQRRKLQRALQSIPKEVPVDGTRTSQSRLVDSVNATRNAFLQAESFLNSYYPEWCSGWLQIYKYEASIEDEIIADVAEMFENGIFASTSDSDSPDMETIEPSKSGEVWERAVVRFSKFNFVWGEYIQWGRAAFDYDLCRNLYRRALKAVKDHVEETCRSYLLFEQQVGSLDDLCVARGRTKTLLKYSKIRLRKAAEFAKDEAIAKALKKTNKRLLSASKNQTSTAESVLKQNHSNSRDFSIYEVTPPDSDLERRALEWQGILEQQALKDANLGIAEGARKQNHSNSRDFSIYGVTPPDSDLERRALEWQGILEQRALKDANLDIADNSISETDHENERGHRKRTKVESDVDKTHDPTATQNYPLPSLKKSGDTNESTTICIKNLSFNSTIEDVLSSFKSCGEVENAVIVLSKAGKSRGQAIVEYLERHSATAALLLNGSLIGERVIEVEMAAKYAFEEMNAGSSAKGPSTHHPTTVFVSKFPITLTNADLKELFVQCGSVLEARIMVDKRTGVSKCHGLVQFLEEEGRVAALRLNKKQYDSYSLSVLPSKFPALNEAPKAFGYYGPNSDKADNHSEELAPEEVKR